MNKMITFSLSFLLISLLAPSFASTYKGVMIAPEISFNNKALKLNGYGVREKWFFDLYVGKLYLINPNHNAKSIIDSNTLMAIDLDIISNKITSKKMISAINEGFNQATNKNTKPLTSEINEFLSAFSDTIKKGDKFRLIYNPQKGTEIYKNGKYLKTIEGMAFKKALFSIWLGEKPADKALKKGLLGKKL